jgi:hypothetical protein
VHLSSVNDADRIKIERYLDLLAVERGAPIKPGVRNLAAEVLAQSTLDPRVLIFISEGAEILSLSERRVFELLDEGAIQSVTIGGARRLVKNSVYELIVTRLIASNPEGPLPKVPRGRARGRNIEAAA